MSAAVLTTVAQWELASAAGAPLDEHCPLVVPPDSYLPALAYDAVALDKPHRVDAPLQSQRSAPVGIIGMCDGEDLNSPDWSFKSAKAGEWRAAPSTPPALPQVLTGIEPCRRTLAGITLAESDPTLLRLEFEGCYPPVAFAVPVKPQVASKPARRLFMPKTHVFRPEMHTTTTTAKPKDATKMPESPTATSATTTTAGPGVSTKPTVAPTASPAISTSTNLVAWMCQISPSLCDKARTKLATIATTLTATTTAASDAVKHFVVSTELKQTQVGKGTCKTSSGSSSVHLAAQESKDCSMECSQRIELNATSSGAAAKCSGYAWSSSSTPHCRLYDGPIEGSNSSDKGDYACVKLELQNTEQKVNAESTQTTTAEPVKVTVQAITPMPVKLMLGQILGAGAVTARRMRINPATPECFQEFEWYTLDSTIFLSIPDFALLTAMRTANGETKPRPQLRDEVLVERVCMRSCSGDLAGICDIDDNVEYKQAFMDALAGHRAPTSTPRDQRIAEKHFNASTKIKMIEEARDDCMNSVRFLPWLVLVSLLCMLFSTIATTCLLLCCRPRKDIPKYEKVETVTLEYDDGKTVTISP
eukprot:gnl/TRDRNA2_/TRDRNA2_42002_c0_seq1.p1 gnl/TRDRNA2_/TRDRNA2_42002_c0~~gnl/TRDRNA2_/TRDRNA2_42002_c0_seq1.p1  ORF type:complete len:604 (+),score=112.45 gnl/TRDRNA2_/TRDRNA2_42002_c0_seq1:47-1813(+)